MTDATLRVDVADFIALVTLDRPPVNAINMQMHSELTRQFDAFTDRDDVRAVIVTGAGRIFSAGADIKNRKEWGPGQRWDYNRSYREMVYSIMECKKPVIAAVNGPALGGGFSIMSLCDILIASEHAEVGLPEINVGVLGGGRMAMRYFSRSFVREMVLTGRRISAAELFRLGVVSHCVPPDKLIETAMDIAAQIASKSPAAVRISKQGLNAVEELGLRDGYRIEQDYGAELGRHADSQEAMRAFWERRPPRFTGQ